MSIIQLSELNFKIWRVTFLFYLIYSISFNHIVIFRSISLSKLKPQKDGLYQLSYKITV